MLDDVPLPDFKPERMAGFLGALIDADDPPPEVPEHPGLRAALADGYVAQTWLGEGGEGEVWRGMDSGNTGREVAIKIRKLSAGAEGGGEVGAGVFADEIRALKRLNHPGVVGLLRQGGQGASEYLVFELVDGLPLEDFIRGRRPEADELLQLLCGVCEAVAAVHAANLVHADLKPSNILVRGDATPVLIDFGLACRPGGEGKAVARRSVRGGTKLFLAPELHAGEAMPSRASDVYALAETFRRAVAAAGRPAPARLVALLERAGQVDPSARLGSAAELGQGLSQLRSSAPQTRRRSRRVAGVLAAVVAALAVTGAWGLGAWAPAQETTAVAPAPAPAAPFTVAKRVQTLLYEGEPDRALAELSGVPDENRGWEWRHLFAFATRPPVIVKHVFDDAGTASVLGGAGETAVVGTGEGRLYRTGLDAQVTDLFRGAGAVGHLASLGGGRDVAVDQRGRVLLIDGDQVDTVARVEGRLTVCWPNADGDGVLGWDADGKNVLRVALADGRSEVVAPAGLVLASPSSPGWVWAVDAQPQGEVYGQGLMGPGWQEHRRDGWLLPESPASMDHDTARGSTVLGTFGGVLRYSRGLQEGFGAWKISDQPLTAVVLSEDERRVFAVGEALYVFDLDREEVVLELPMDLPGLAHGIRWNADTAALTVVTDQAIMQWKAPRDDNFLALR